MARFVAPLLVLLSVACSGSENGANPAPTEAPATETPGPESAPGATLLFLHRTTLMSFEIGSGLSVVAELPSADVALSPDTQSLVVVRETSPLGPGPEGFRDPELLLRPTDGDAAERLGPGRSPLWSPDGQGVAAIVAAGGENCPGVETEGAGCPGAEQVVVYDPADPGGPPETVTGPALGYSLLGWLGTDVVSLRAPGVTVLGDQPLPFTPSEIWGASPSGDIVLQVDDNGARFTGIDAQAPQAEVNVDGAGLADGTWSYDGGTVAVVLIKPSGARVISRLALIDTDSGVVTIVPDSEGAQGQVVWDASSSRFAYVRINPADARKLQAVSCSIELDCRELFPFRQGVALLGLR